MKHIVHHVRISHQLWWPRYLFKGVSWLFVSSGLVPAMSLERGTRSPLASSPDFGLSTIVFFQGAKKEKKQPVPKNR